MDWPELERVIDNQLIATLRPECIASMDRLLARGIPPAHLKSVILRMAEAHGGHEGSIIYLACSAWIDRWVLKVLERGK